MKDHCDRGKQLGDRTIKDMGAHIVTHLPDDPVSAIRVLREAEWLIRNYYCRDIFKEDNIIHHHFGSQAD